MRASMTELRAGGRALPSNARQSRRGILSTVRFQGGDTSFRVLQFQDVNSMPQQFLLYDPRVKDCPAEGTVVCYSGLAREGGAWVAQEWLIDIAPESPVGRGWTKPGRRYDASGVG
jgi:hypothetical protein